MTDKQKQELRTIALNLNRALDNHDRDAVEHAANRLTVFVMTSMS